MSGARFGLRPRVFAGVFTVAIVSSLLTGLIVRNRTLAAAREAAVVDVNQTGDIFDELGRYPFENGSWDNVADRVNELAKNNDVRIVLTDDERRVFASADSNPGSAIPLRPQAVFYTPASRSPADEVTTSSELCLKGVDAPEVLLPDRFETFASLVEAIDNPNTDGDAFDQALNDVPTDNRNVLKNCLSDFFDRDGPEVYEYLGEGEGNRLRIAGVGPATWLLLLVSALGFAIASAAFVARRIAKPLRALTSATTNISEGTMTHRITVNGSDEVAVLGKAFNDMAGKLEVVESQRSQLVRDLAHELRNPLGVLQGSIEAAIDGVVPLTDESLLMMHSEVRHLSELVNDLQQLSAFDSGGITFTPALMEIHQLIGHVVETYRVANPELEFQVISEHFTFTADRVRVRQVLANLIRNAVQHTSDGGRISVTAKQVAGQVMIAVADTGSGIAPDQLPLVFDRFWRGDDSRRRDVTTPHNQLVRGSGLGLSICKAIVEGHGGTIRVESTLGKGTTFYINLPMTPRTGI